MENFVPLKLHTVKNMAMQIQKTCFISKNICLIFDDVTEKIHINKNDTYYDQIQMKFTLATQIWCDFLFYTSKGLVIDRFFYDKEYWGKLQKPTD